MASGESWTTVSLRQEEREDLSAIADVFDCSTREIIKVITEASDDIADQFDESATLSTFAAAFGEAVNQSQVNLTEDVAVSVHADVEYDDDIAVLSMVSEGHRDIICPVCGSVQATYMLAPALTGAQFRSFDLTCDQCETHHTVDTLLGVRQGVDLELADLQQAFFRDSGQVLYNQLLIPGEFEDVARHLREIGTAIDDQQWLPEPSVWQERLDTAAYRKTVIRYLGAVLQGIEVVQEINVRPLSTTEFLFEFSGDVPIYQTEQALKGFIDADTQHWESTSISVRKAEGKPALLVAFEREEIP